MYREEIKEIVYNSCHQFIMDDDYWNINVLGKSNDGENLQLVYELGLDALDLIEFLMDLEKKFSISLPDSIFVNNSTLGIIIDYIYNIKK